MSFFFPKKSKVKPQFTGLQTMTSTSALPIVLGWGKNRIAPNIIWQGDFKSHKKKQKAGKGGGSTTTYTYSASFQLALCWGPIVGVTRVWKDQSKETSYAALGFSLFLGTTPQAPWGYLTTAHPTEALGYPGIAHLDVANYDLGNSNTIQQHSFETEFYLCDTGVGGTVEDADPALIVEDFLDNDQYGVGFNTTILSNLLSTVDAPTTGDSAYQTYCQAMGFALSPALVGQSSAGEIIERWAMLTNTAIVWTGYSLKYHPYGSDEVTANGVTYLPDFPVRYILNDDDYIYAPGEDPISFNRTDPADAFNSLSLIIANRDNEYNELPVPWRDQGLVDTYRLRQDDPIEAKEICDPEMAAIMASLIGMRRAYIRNTFEFKLGVAFCLIEPMDVLQCTDPRLGTFYVLIKEVTEDDEDFLSFVAEEYPSSISTASSNVAQSSSNTPINTAISPGPVNPPIIFEPPASLAGTPQVWAAVSGGDGTTYNPNWGGAFVWLSTDDITYDNIGDIDTAARQGKLTSVLAAYGGANPDTVNTLSVDLRMSNGELSDAASAADAAAGVTASYVGGEILSYELTTLTDPDEYDLDSLYRGQYGTVDGAHGIGDNFARLDDSIFKFDLPADYIGVTLYLKFQSYNIFGGGVEDLSSVVAYTYTPTGASFGGGTGGAPTTPTNLAGSAGSTFSYLTWDPNPSNDVVLSYEVWRATGAGQAFGSATRIAAVTGAATEYTDSAVTGDQAYTYFLVATNAIGSSTNTAGLDLTPTAGSAVWRAYGSFAGMPDAGMELFDIEMVGDEAFATGLPSNLGSVDVAPADGAAVFPIKHNGLTVGSMNVAMGATTATWTLASGFTPAAGDRLSFYAPTVQDSAMSGISYTFIATR